MQVTPMQLKLADLVREFAPLGLALTRPEDADRIVTGVAAPEVAGHGDLVFVDRKQFLPLLVERRPAAVVTSAKLQACCAELPGTAVLVARNVTLAHALIKARYAGRDYAASGWEGVHPSAVVHESAQLEADVVVEPRAVVGARVRIGRGSRIMAGAVIENDVVIGAGSIIHPAAVVGFGCRIGSGVVIGSGTVIGSEGFGFAQDEQRHSHAIPQTGIVVIGDRVRVGAGSCIDRATYQETRIGAGTKLDNLCHIAHNVSIGEDCLLTAMLCVAGSTRIGNRVMASGQTGIIDHVEVCDDVVLVHRAGVVKSISAPGVHAGLPAQPLDDYLRNTAASRTGSELRRRVTELERGLGARAGSSAGAGGERSDAAEAGPAPAPLCENS